METIILYLIFSYAFMAGQIMSVKVKDYNLFLIVGIWIISPVSFAFFIGYNLK